MDRKTSVSNGHRTLVSKSEEVERFRSPLASLCPATFGVFAKLDQTGLLAMQLQAKFCSRVEEMKMSIKTIWMVRSGKGAKFVDDFIEEGFVGIGWESAGDVSVPVDKAEIERRMTTLHPSNSKGKISMSASQVKRYYEELRQSAARGP